jgi:hypothetical protein
MRVSADEAERKRQEIQEKAQKGELTFYYKQVKIAASTNYEILWVCETYAYLFVEAKVVFFLHFADAQDALKARVQNHVHFRVDHGVVLTKGKKKG